MSLTSLVLAFAGAMAAKVKPAALERRLEAFEFKAEFEASSWALETVRGELWATREALEATREALRVSRIERDALREALAHNQALQNGLAQQAQQAQYNAAQLAQYHAAQLAHDAQNYLGLGQLGALGLGAQQAQQQAYGYCMCVPGRAGILRGPGA